MGIMGQIGPMRVVPTPDIAKNFHPTPDIKGKKMPDTQDSPRHSTPLLEKDRVIIPSRHPTLLNI